MSNAKQSESTASPWAYALVGVGLVLVLVGLSWNWLVAPDQVWSEQDYQEFAAAYESAHAASSGHTHDEGEHSDDNAEAPPDLETARAELNQARNRLERARTFHQYTGKAMSIVGLIIAGGGAVMLRKRGE
ncbi:hypothetical protein [Aeoliella mucimassa]|uniref:Uncharacterized protein n=1 Tax=Aeoliella mucimassa TaxID=2527972 RepID=A0A518AHB1_9BACT|nr:hypothetical protein [Aeoliella mucimassa]QDU54120.1 hypothetical protein Pan181_03000 [Aeoliella mucimassa]